MEAKNRTSDTKRVDILPNYIKVIQKKFNLLDYISLLQISAVGKKRNPAH